MIKKFLIFIFIFLQINSVYASNLIENISFEDRILSFDAKENGMFISLLSKDYREILSFVNDSAEVEYEVEKEDLSGLRLRVININSEPDFDSIGQGGVTQGAFNSPGGIFVDYFGRLFVADKMNNRVQSFNRNHNFRFEFGKFGWASSIQELRAQFNKPVGVAVNRFIYVADTDNHRIARFDIDGNYLSGWGGSGQDRGEFNYPHGLALDLSGNIYVADTENNRVQKFNANGNYVLSFGNFGRGIKQFNKPRYIAVDLDYHIYVSDYRNNRVQVFDRFGGFVKYLRFGREYINRPVGISVDSNFVAVASQKDKAVFMSDKDEKYTARVKLPFKPEDVHLSGDKLYISAPDENKIYFFSFERTDYVF
ncbi:MAG: SMP-30/gluconolactonase/LRE family protein [Candidatus Muiribacteriota bacterium]